MRRALVLGDETARHPFLKTLPPHVRRGGAPVRTEASAQAPQPWLSRADMRDFALAFGACFLAVFLFVS